MIDIGLLFVVELLGYRGKIQVITDGTYYPNRQVKP